MQASNLRPGQGVRMDGKVYVITGIEHRTPGNLRAFVQLKYRDVLKGLTNEKRFAPTAEMELVELDRREMEYLYSDNTGATFMDSESYEQYVLNEGVLGDSLLFLKPNTKAIVLMQDGNPLMVELPPTVELAVKDCPPEVKGATVTNQLKDAEMETGLKIRVPGFIKVGETLRISTVTREYQSRA
ncbi:MAG: elongation factor P [Phycisphaerales bacterium]|nr:elongation factor P [Phycisphaerales bacterium]